MSLVRCKRCVMPTSRPDTAFVDGACSACLSYEKRPAIDWDARKSELLSLLDRHNGRCIVPSSGGKDSTAQVLMLKELGAEVTVVTATTCFLTPIGRHNIDNLARHAQTIEVTPNRERRAKLNRLGLEMIGDISWPEHVSIFSTPFRMAVALNIPLMFYGENPQNQYGGPPGSEEARQMTRRWTQEFGGFLGLRVADFEAMGYDMREYQLPSDADMGRVGVEAHFLGQYLPWDSESNARVAAEHGMQCGLPSFANLWPCENLDNAMTGVHDFFGWLKYGYGRAAAQVSVDIRRGKLTRDEGMSIVKARDGLFPVNYAGVPLSTILEHIGMTESQFISACNAFTNRSLFNESSIEWGQKLTVRGE